MARSSLFAKTKIVSLLLPLVAFGAGVIGAVTSYDAKPKTTAVVTQAPQTTYVVYNGEEGQNALDILKKQYDVQTKHYDFGDLVTAINGTEGNGPKYWSFYVNGQLSEVGASVYVTHDSDKIEWKLQAL